MIGTETSTKLAADFAAWDAPARVELDAFNYGTYQNFRRAFEMASDGGAVDFG